MLGIESKNADSQLNITEFGTFTANFRVAPPAIPNEYLIGLYTIVASTMVGWSIPTIIGWIKSRQNIRKLNYYHKKINLLFKDGKLDDNDIEPLDKLKTNISDAYAKGKINAEYYSNLKDEISVLYQEIINKRIQLLNNVSDKGDKQKTIEKIKDDIYDAYSKTKLTKLHYNLLNKKILEYENKNNNY